MICRLPGSARGVGLVWARRTSDHEPIFCSGQPPGRRTKLVTMPYLVPGAALRVAGVVLWILSLPVALARSQDSATQAPTCALSSDVAPDDSELASPAPEIPEPSPLDIRVAEGQHWRLETPRGVVHVWLPPEYDAATAQTVVFVHGYKTDLETMWNGAQLPQQFARSGVNAMYIAPEAPYAKLVPMVWPSLDALLQAGTAGTHQPLP